MVDKRTESAVLAATLVALIVLVARSIAVLEFEQQDGGNIASAQDAMGWSIFDHDDHGYGESLPGHH